MSQYSEITYCERKDDGSVNHVTFRFCNSGLEVIITRHRIKPKSIFNFWRKRINKIHDGMYIVVPYDSGMFRQLKHNLDHNNYS